MGADTAPRAASASIHRSRSTNGTDAKPAGHGRRCSVGEEIANAVSHGTGALLSVAALVVLVAAAALRGDALTVVAYAVFGSSLVLLYTASTIYHALSRTRAVHVLEILDHASIYVLIAGTYTAFCLTTLRGRIGWTIFGICWAMAIAGIVMKAVFFPRFGKLSLVGYLAMGWLVVFAFRPLAAALHPTALALLVAGGISYSAGTVFYALKRVPWFHSVWHLFVLGGSTCHALAAVFALTLA